MAAPQLPLPKPPYHPPPEELEKRLPGLTKWYQEQYEKEVKFYKEMQIAIFGVAAP